MLCRALLAVVVFTYVLCVLVLSGVQKEDLDASTIRKLQRHNVNIDDINDRQLQKQCLGKTDNPVTLTTPHANPTTGKTEITVTDYASKGSQTEDTTPIQKIFEYLEFMGKEEKNKALETEENTNKSELELEPLAKLSSSSFRRRVQQTDFEDPSSETPPILAKKKKQDEKLKTANFNTELENFMKILRANINRLPDSTPQESSTVKIVKGDSISKNTKDVDYITKIVDDIISRRQLKEVNTTKGPTSNLNTNETIRDVDEIADSQRKNKSISLTNYYLNNCKLRNFYASNQGDKEKYEIFDTDKTRRSGINEPHSPHINTNNNRSKAKEQKIVPDQKDNSIVNNILKELKQESERFKLLDKESVIGKSLEPISETTLFNPKNDIIKPGNIDKGGVNILYGKPLETHSKSIVLNSQSDRNNISDAYKDGLEVSDGVGNNALQIVLQAQSKLFNQIFNQQRNLLKMSNTEKEKLTLRENERPEPLKFALKNQPNSRVFEQIESMGQSPTSIDEKTHKLQPKLEEKPAKVMVQSPPFNYKSTKSDNDVINDEYTGWRLVASNTLNNEDKAIETINNGWINNRMDDKFKPTNTQNTLDGVEYDANLNKEYIRPWFYAELSKKKPKTEINGNKPGIFFIPNGRKKITNTIDPRLKTSYEKSWSPYFDNDTSITKTDEYLKIKTQQSSLVDSSNPSLSRSNNRKLLRNLIDTSITYPKMVEMYQNDIKSPDVEEFENKQDEKTNQVRCQTVYEKRIECLSAGEYKSDCAYLRKNHSKKQKPLDNYLGRYKTNIDEDNLLCKNKTKESIKTPAIPSNVIKDIANSIKDFVLKDLKTTTSTSIISPTTSIILTTTTTPKTTTITPTTTSTTSKSTTTEETITTTANNSLKIQDATKVLEKFMEMFEKLTLMKESLKPENFTYAQYVTTQKARTDGQERPAKQKETTLDYILKKDEHRVSPYPQPLQQNIGNIERFVPHVAQLPISNQITENRLPYDPGSIQQGPENRDPNRSQPVQMKAEIEQYYLPPLQRHPENRVSYYSQATQSRSDTQTPYTPGVVQLKIDKSTPYLTQTVRLKAKTNLPYDLKPLKYNLENRVAPDLQHLQRNPEDNIPNYLQLLQRSQGSNNLYLPQALQLKTQAVQNYPENRAPYVPETRAPYVPENRTYVPGEFELKTENRMGYLPQALQSKRENQYPYELQYLQRNPEIRDPYGPLALKYLSHAAELQGQNRIPYDLQGEKTENHTPYYPPPLQHSAKDRPYDYSVMEPYRHSENEFDTTLQEVKPPVSKKKPAKAKGVITVQTNSGEISPLKIVLQKPFFQNVVLTTQPPVTVPKASNEDIYNFRKPPIKTNRHHEEFKESEDIKDMKEDQEYKFRHAHKDTHIANKKSRKTKKEREVLKRFVPRDLEEIQRFHEKLERTDSWPREEQMIAKRVQRPIVKNTNYDDRHFRNFLQTQQKVNAMLEKILASGKAKAKSVEII